jgi:hypothetical protein
MELESHLASQLGVHHICQMNKENAINDDFQSDKAERHNTQVELFAREFRDEDHLRRVVADLFMKMGQSRVRITHGSGEKGKDIIFYGEGPLGERRLFACVVKNKAISGRADDHKNGAPTLVGELQTVANQIQSSFAEPLADGRGNDEWVDSVYVICPHDCPIATMDSIKSRLQRSGQITFICGSQLMELFVKHWPQFLWFESSILVSYLSALRKGLEEDYALANLILKNPYLGESPSAWSDLYVEPRFHRELRPLHLRHPFALNLDILSGLRKLSDVKSFKSAASGLAAVLATAPMWAGEPNSPVQVGRDVLKLADSISELWKVRSREYFSKLQSDARQRRSRSSQGFSVSGAFTDASNMLPSEQEITVELRPSDDLIARSDALHSSIEGTISILKEQAATATRFASASHPDVSMALQSSEFITYCRIAEAASLDPQAFTESATTQTLIFEENLLDAYPGSVLITGPAGYGKTTFCRWHAIHDANRLVQKQASVLPVYRALHPLSRGTLSSFHEAFFPEEELKKLIQQQAAGQSPFSHIRLYLDGLDEVTSIERQEQIVSLAEQAVSQWNFVQVILTGRDHVNSSALSWLPRIRLSELSEEKIRALAFRWLGAEEVPLFFERLKESGNITDLMRIPLLATLILAVFRKTKSVPPNKTRLYTLFVELLCGGWDFYKNIQRRNTGFGLRDKEVVLTRLAGMLQHDHKRDASESDFRAAIKNSMNSIAPEWEQFLQDTIEDGLLQRVGSTLTFSHLSFQEFLASRDLRDHMGQRPKQALGWYLKGDDWWKEALAFYVTLLDRPGEADEWLLKRAIATSTIVPDLEDRVQYLRRALKAAFPAYHETAVCTALLGDLTRKAQKYGATHIQSQYD